MKTLLVNAKCSDLCWMALENEKTRLGEYDGYVPAWFPSRATHHFGDYVELKIDIETGKILNWKKPTKEDLQETFEGKQS